VIRNFGQRVSESRTLNPMIALRQPHAQLTIVTPPGEELAASSGSHPIERS
jgi:hypothetical protein